MWWLRVGAVRGLRRKRVCGYERRSGLARGWVPRLRVWLEKRVTRRMLCGVLRNRFQGESAAMEGIGGEGFVAVGGRKLGEMAHVSRVVGVNCILMPLCFLKVVLCCCQD